MSLEKLFKTNANLEVSGVVIDYGPNDDLPAGPEGKPPIQFRIARAGGANQAHNKALTQLTKPHRRAIQLGQLTNDLAKNIDRQAWLDSCLLGWNNVTLGGEPLEFNRENAERLFTALPDLYADLREQSNNMALFREDVLEADLGNSGRSLSTGSPKDQ